MISRCKSQIVAWSGYVFLGMLCWSWSTNLGAQDEAQWIWSPDHDEQHVPNASCHFRKDVSCRNPERARIEITADDSYELFVNGRQVGSAAGNTRAAEYDISRMIMRGRNVVAIRVTNSRGNTAGLAARIWVKERNGDWAVTPTSDSWKTNLRPLPLWNTAFYNDSFWTDARMLRPWVDEERIKASPSSSPKTTQVAQRKDADAGQDAPQTVAPVKENAKDVSTPRFKVASEFAVEEVLNAELTGSLLAMTFNEFGHIIASRDGGPLLLIHDSDKDGIPDKVREYCSKVKGCQGILALNGEVFVTGEGPDGNALYRLSDTDRDGKLETVKTLFKFTGAMGEHGPHGITLGPDGWIYVVVGNHSAPETAYATSSPHRDWYEGDLVGPRYEDPGGHAVGVKAPGGVVVRTKVNGDEIQCVAGGLRNAYDLAFNGQGDLFVHDSDMEADIGMTWYRPTQLYLVTPGAEYGWRSGWAAWPEYYTDALPPILKTGRGSPTAAVTYSHFMFPKRFHDTLFLADWSEGRILNARLKPDGAGYKAESEVFLEGEPLNVTDMDIAPDGALYFVTGGRGTLGGVYRVRWKGEVPPAVKDLGEGISAVIRQPQIQSAWARQKVALVKQQMGDKWNSQIAGVARSVANPPPYRTRALDLMQLLGPAPSEDFLKKLSAEKDPLVRAKAAELMGLQQESETADHLIELLADDDALVRRKACEAILRAGHSVPIEKLLDALKSADQFVAVAARRLLERMPVEDWKETVLSSQNHRVFINGGLALMVAHPEKENALAVLERFHILLGGFISDPNFVDMLRVVQVALHRAEIAPEEVGELTEQLADEFPASDPIINRELVRVLVYLQATSPIDRYVSQLKSATSELDRLHLALNLKFLQTGWKDGQRLKVIEFLEKAQSKNDTGSAYPLYVSYVTRDLAKAATPEEAREILAKGDQWPGAALGALYTLPRELDDETRAVLIDIDEKITENTEDASMRLKVGIVAVLARHADDEAFSYLRQVWDKDPERRVPVAIGLSQSPDGPNWDYLVKSLAILDGVPARDVLTRLRSVDRHPDDPESYRQVIIRGLMLKEEGAAEAISLLELWSGEKRGEGTDDWSKTLAAWQVWYSEEYPDRPEAKLPSVAKDSKWKMDDLLKHLSSAEAQKGSPDRGSHVFAKAQCAKCHRYAGKGESLGPDLTSIRKRFQRKEIVEAILYPSHVVSDQFAAKTVVTAAGRSYTGIVTPLSDKETVVLTPTGEKVTIKNEEIEETTPSKISSMPANLLDPLTLDEISDLFAYLGVLNTPSVARRNMNDQK